MLSFVLLAGCSFGPDLDTSHLQPCIDDGDCHRDEHCSAEGYCAGNGRLEIVAVLSNDGFAIDVTQDATDLIAPDSLATDPGDPCAGKRCMPGETCQDGVCACPLAEPGTYEVCDPDAGEVCCLGGCCRGGEMCCDGMCVDRASDEANCGRCGNACAAGERCCAGSCVDPGDDDANCGACGNLCALGQGCCDGRCAELSRDAQNCGACGVVCGSQEACCSGRCAQIMDDETSCGACGFVCGAGESCCHGVCRTLTDDPANCGGCGVVCSTNQAHVRCRTGQCELTCLGTFADCDGEPANGCETDLMVDAAHCGSCGAPCESGYACVDGTCIPSGCGPTEVPCGTTCADLSTSATHCGACTNDCTAHPGIEQASCDEGTCEYSCSQGLSDCTPSPGCETSIGTDVLHCGGCGQECGSTNGVPSCVDGTCRIACQPGFADCDGDPANGCEVTLATDADHCGACENDCGDIETLACVDGGCTVVCPPSYEDCDGELSNGCETSLRTRWNCLSCGARCTGAETCCEHGCARLRQDVDNCGACGNVCSDTGGTPACHNGVCEISCDEGRADCDGDASNGCETVGPCD